MPTADGLVRFEVIDSVTGETVGVLAVRGRSVAVESGALDLARQVKAAARREPAIIIERVGGAELFKKPPAGDEAASLKAIFSSPLLLPNGLIVHMVELDEPSA